MTGVGPPALRWDRGTLVVSAQPPQSTMAWFQHDVRTAEWRAEARHYREIVMAWRASGSSFIDEARKWERLIFPAPAIVPREHQAKAIDSWLQADKRGVVQLPTGAGKTILAVLAMHRAERPTLVLVPTIDLVIQWQAVLEKHFPNIPVGTLGGGSREIRLVTVSTYDSAVIFAERIGQQFGLLIADECHHLPAPQYQQIARMTMAPFRLGLSATVTRPDGKEETVFDLMGPLVYDAKIRDMQGSVLSPYDVIKIEVSLNDVEANGYAEARRVYTDFVKRSGVNFSSGTGWAEFVWKSARLPGGKLAMRAWREQKRLAQAASGKMQELWKILCRHNGQRMIVFTNDNELAYRIGREFVLPVLTHQTRMGERKHLLEAFRNGELEVLVTSKVLNEGVDVPEASVGVVVSGSGGVREHVQRLGRILRHKPGKRATLYELVTRGTSELSTLARRRQHDAYQRVGQGKNSGRQAGPEFYRS
jgi:superfamily II DNA or RNA helicase